MAEKCKDHGGTLNCCAYKTECTKSDSSCFIKEIKDQAKYKTEEILLTASTLTHTAFLNALQTIANTAKKLNYPIESSICEIKLGIGALSFYNARDIINYYKDIVPIEAKLYLAYGSSWHVEVIDTKGNIIRAKSSYDESDRKPFSYEESPEKE